MRALFPKRHRSYVEVDRFSIAGFSPELVSEKFVVLIGDPLEPSLARRNRFFGGQEVHDVGSDKLFGRGPEDLGSRTVGEED